MRSAGRASGESSPEVTQAGERRSVRIESLRACAALGVVACHTWGFATLATWARFHDRVILSGGFLGVDVFFALTGYLIFLPFARRDYGSGAAVSLRGYALNRALRILPLYYAVLLIVAALDGSSLATIARFAWFGENFREATVAKVLDTPMWSLVIEVAFYLLLPLLAWLLARCSGGSARRAAVWLLVLAGASVAVSEAGLQPADVWDHSVPANFVFFVPGMLVALLKARDETARVAWLAHPLARADLGLVLAVATWLALLANGEVMFTLLPAAAIGSLLVVASVALPVRRGGLDRILDFRPLALLGVASYSLYLWHWPVINWLPHPVRAGYGSWLVFLAYALPSCLAISFVSYRIIEAPPLRLRRRWFAGSPVQPSAEAMPAFTAPAELSVVDAGQPSSGPSRVGGGPA